MVRPSLLALLCLFGPLVAQDPRMVADVNPYGTSTAAFPILGRTPRGDAALAALDDGVHGTELWRTDGTAAGTMLVTELVPGRWGAIFSGGVSDSSGCYFIANRGSGDEMWRSDGTAAGTQMLFSALSVGATFLTLPQPYARVGNHWLFNAWANTVDRLWLSDGTANGTMPLGAGASDVRLAYGGSFYANEYSGWRVHVVTPTSPPTLVTFVDSYVSTFRGGPVLVHYAFPPPPAPTTSTITAIAWPGQPTVAGIVGQVFPFEFGNALAWFDEQFGLWTWDLANSPVQLHASAATPTGADVMFFGDRMMFTGQDGASGREPWITDGTVAGTHALDLTPGPADSTFSFIGSIAHGQRALLMRDTPATGLEPWSTDGTVAGTQMIADLEPGPAGSSIDSFDWITSMVGQRRLVAGVHTQARGWELWLTDGTPAGSRFLNEIRPGPANGLPLHANGTIWPYAVGHRLLFFADDGVHGAELWAVDLEGSTTQIEWQGTRRFDVRGDPVIGAAVEFASAGLAAQDIGAVAIGWPAVPTPLGVGGTYLHVDLALPVMWLPVTPDASGAWSQSVVVPNVPGLAGLDLVAQAGFLGPSTGSGIELGPAFWLGLGN
jgi:ELWxxDGT repeat protein